RRFDDAARAALVNDPTEAAALASHRDFARAAPTPDHFLPLLYLAGMASAAGRTAKVLTDGYAFGSLSMTSYTLDCACPPGSEDRRPSAGLPDPVKFPPEDTNT